VVPDIGILNIFLLQVTLSRIPTVDLNCAAGNRNSKGDRLAAFELSTLSPEFSPRNHHHNSSRLEQNSLFLPLRGSLKQSLLARSWSGAAKLSALSASSSG